MNNLLPYCGLVDARISSSDKDLPVTCQLIFILPLSNQDTQLKRMGLATLPRILCAFDVFDTHGDDCRLPTHVLILGLHKGNKTFSELDLKNKGGTVFGLYF